MRNKISSKSKQAARWNLRKAFRKCLLTAVAIGSVGGGFLAVPGCTRQHYRAKTDTEAYYLLDEKRQQSAEVNPECIRIELDPRSRMFDPFNPDRPPMPEDDPQANRFMKKVDNKNGYPLWEANGRTNIVENPEWWQYLPLDERGVLVVDLDDSVRLALLHSPGYQQNLETMYLSALDVSIERFRLDSQFFGGTGTSFARTGPVRSGNPFGTTVPSIGSSAFRMNKLYAAGGSLVTSVANSLTWQIAGPDTFTSPSLVSFGFIQPLLAGGGRDVVLERLTLAERSLLTNVRAFERYRRGFYTQIATGVGPDTSPSRRGGAFGGAGLGGFDALGSVFNNAGFGGGGGGAVQNANGYIGILQDQLSIANTKENIVQLQDIYLQYQDSYEELTQTMPETSETISQRLQVAQAKQNLQAQQAALLDQQSAYQATLDGFKRLMGLPPYLCIEVKGDMLNRFKLISQELRDRRTQMSEFRAAAGVENSRLLQLSVEQENAETGRKTRAIAASPEVVSALVDLRQQLSPIQNVLQTMLSQDVPAIQSDIETLKNQIPARKRQLARLREIVDSEREMVCALLPLGSDFSTEFLESKDLETTPGILASELTPLSDRIKEGALNFQKLLDRIDAITENLGDIESDAERFKIINAEIILGSQNLIVEINENILAAQLIQAKARTQSVTLPDITLEPRDAVEIARNNRRDWLIRRAALVDAWRSIELVADNLESALNFTLTGDVGNVGTNPFALHSSNGTLRAGLTWDAPITRVQERNNYRQVLIQYQQARRGYYQFEDGIWNSMRSALRSVRQTQLAFEIQRSAVQNAALQISLNDDIRQLNESNGQLSGPTAARDTLQGLQDFLRTQNQLIGLFATYESTRRVLDRDLGTMQIDSEGLWIDPGPLTLETVGGGVCQAIVEYGLEAGQELVPDRLQFGEAVKVIPTDEMPSLTQEPGRHESGVADWQVVQPIDLPANVPTVGAAPQLESPNSAINR